MKKQHENTLFFFFIFSSLLGWNLYSSDLFADKCTLEYASKNWERTVERTKSDPNKKHLIENIKNSISELNLPPEAAKATMQKMGTIAALHKHNCEIPDSLKNQVENSLYPNQKPTADQVMCADDAFREEAKTEIMHTKNKSPEFFTQKENKVYQLFKDELQNHLKHAPKKQEAILAAFNEKWDDDKYRQDFMLAFVRTDLRKQNNCNNPDTPLKNVTMELFSHLMKNNIRSHSVIGIK